MFSQVILPLASSFLLYASLATGNPETPEEDEFSSPVRPDPVSSAAGSSSSSSSSGVWADGKVSLRGLWSLQWAKQELTVGTTEILAVGVIALYIAVYIKGRRRNYKISTQFIRAVHGLFCSRFLEAGPPEPPSADRRQLLSHDSPSNFLYFATGSRMCDAVLVSIDLAKRHDLFMLLWGLLSPVHDTVTIEVALDEEDMEPMVFAVTPKRWQRTVLQEVPHLADYASVVRAPLLPSGLICFSETPALMESLLQPAAEKILGEYSDLLELMCFTDQNEQPILGCTVTPKKTLRFRFRLPPVSGDRTGDLRGATKMVELALYYIEALHKFKMYPGMKKKALERREAVAKRKFKLTNAQRQERFQQLKNEKLQREREEYESLTPEQKRRRDLRDEKKAKKAANSRKPRMKLSK